MIKKIKLMNSPLIIVFNQFIITNVLIPFILENIIVKDTMK